MQNSEIDLLELVKWQKYGESIILWRGKAIISLLPRLDNVILCYLLFIGR